MILLTDEEILEVYGGRCSDVGEIAKAQLKKVCEDIKERPCNAACQSWKDDLLQALLKEIQ